MKKYKRILFSAAVFAIVLLLWEFAVRYFEFAEYMLPAPLEVAAYLCGAICMGHREKIVYRLFHRSLRRHSNGNALFALQYF